jgi:hypothetical protein
MSLPALYLLTAEYRAAAEALAEIDPSDPAYLDALEAIKHPVETKSYSVACIVRQMEALAEAQAEAAKELSERAARSARHAERLRKYLADNLRAAGISRIDAAPDRPAFSIRFQKNPPAVDIWDEAQVPNDFMRTPPPPKPIPDKKAIAAAIKAGMEIPGTRLVESDRLVIK